MTADRQRRSVIEEVEQDPLEAADIAAARAMNHTIVLLAKARSESQLSQREIAEILGIGESRVSQVLNGDGNIKISTLGRFLRAMGYTPEFEAKPIDSSKGVLSARNPKAKNRRRRKNVSVVGDETFRTLAASRLVIEETDKLLKGNRAVSKHRAHRIYRSSEMHETMFNSGKSGESAWIMKKS